MSTLRPILAFAWGSRSIKRTRFSCVTRAPVRLIAVVVLPTPPLLLAIAIIRGEGMEGWDGASAPLRLGIGSAPSERQRWLVAAHSIIHPKNLCSLMGRSDKEQVLVASPARFSCVADIMMLRLGHSNPFLCCAGMLMLHLPGSSEPVMMSPSLHSGGGVAARPAFVRGVK